MPAPIDAAEVRRVAKLARLNLRDEEVQLFATQLAAILEYVQQLNEVETRGVEPLAHALPVCDVRRDDDTAGPTLDTTAALANAPQREQSFFKVPAVLDGGGA